MDPEDRAELHRLELELLEPGVRRDRERMERILEPDFVEFGSSGRVWPRSEILELLSREPYSRPEVEDFLARMLAPGVALVTYCAVRAGGAPSSRSLRSSIWVKQGAGWRIAFHQGTPAGPAAAQG